MIHPIIPQKETKGKPRKNKRKIGDFVDYL
jgi:hypothetical protein